MSIFSLDFETTSLADIKSVGAWRYAADPSTRILMFAIRQDEGEPVLWRFDQPNSPESKQAATMLQAAVDSNSLLYAFNVGFELAISTYRLMTDVGIEPPSLEQWRCVQAMCRRAAIPEHLGVASAFMGLEEQKDKSGLALINLFSNQGKDLTLTRGKEKRKSLSPILENPIPWDWMTRVGGEPVTVREAWEMFMSYCKQDVRAERELHKRLARFELTGDELASFQFDLRMNARGVPVNVAALAHAQSLIVEYQDRLEASMERLCGLRSSQGIRLQEWLTERGYKETNLQADTVEKVLANPGGMTAEAVDVLRHRALLSFAAIKKIPTMLACACPDGVVRGTTQWHGARTGRATGRIIQPQNMKKATIADSALAYQMICEGQPLEHFELLWSSPLEVFASCARHFMQPSEGMMLDADYVGVEARIAPWLAGEEEKLQSILDGLDQYKVMASEIVFHIPYDEVTKAQRTVGKPIELSCCYGTGGRGLRDALRDTHGVHKTLKECNAIVKAYREKFPKMVQLWRDMEDAAKAAIRSGQVTQVADGKMAFGAMAISGIPYLVMRLPSGRRMYYPNPTIKPVFKLYEEEDMLEDPAKRERKGYWSDSISFYGKTEQTWTRIHTWGSRLFENACQAIGADLLNYGCIQAEKEGYDIWMIVHDQALAAANKPLEGFIEALCRKQPWAETFPLEADGNTVPYYLKD